MKSHDSVKMLLTRSERSLDIPWRNYALWKGIALCIAVIAQCDSTRNFATLNQHCLCHVMSAMLHATSAVIVQCKQEK